MHQGEGGDQGDPDQFFLIYPALFLLEVRIQIRSDLKPDPQLCYRPASLISKILYCFINAYYVAKEKH